MIKNIISVVLLACCQTAFAAEITATALLDYAQEVTPSNSTPSSATGTATIVFDDIAGTLDLTAEISGISLADITFPNGSGILEFDMFGPFHIHQAPVGSNGGIEVAFPSASFFSDTPGGISVTATDVAFDTALLTSLFSGDLYLNLHTLDYGSGEIRGQLSAVPLPLPLALLLLPLGLLARFRRTV